MSSTGNTPARGCVSLLGGPLLAFGIWMIVQAFFLPHEAETVRVSVITGAFCALLGGWLVATRMRARSARRGRPGSGQEPQADDDGTPAGIPRAIDRIDPGIGCVVIPIGFLLFGAVMLYFYFSGTPSRRGNPVMGLVAGIIFTAVGLVGLYGALVATRPTSGSKSGDPRRLP